MLVKKVVHIISVKFESTTQKEREDEEIKRDVEE